MRHKLALWCQKKMHNNRRDKTSEPRRRRDRTRKPGENKNNHFKNMRFSCRYGKFLTILV